jgi:hypothetical protein
MQKRVIGFIPPVVGIESEFNTFRLGGFYPKCLNPGEEVYLLDEKAKMIIGRAQVQSVEVGPLGEMCLIHGAKNHTEIANDPADAHARLYALLCKIYGPHIATVTKKTAVIYLKRIE